MKKRVVIGISGASGSIIAVELLRAFQQQADWETHLVITDGGKKTISMELKESLDEIVALADVYHDNRNIGASIASGTFRTEGMVFISGKQTDIDRLLYGDNGIFGNALGIGKVERGDFDVVTAIFAEVTHQNGREILPRDDAVRGKMCFIRTVDNAIGICPVQRFFVFGTRHSVNKR